MKEISYFKTQWWRLLVAIFCLVMACVYIFQPSPDTTTIEGLNTLIAYMFTAGLHFCGFIIWSFMSFIDCNQKRIKLLEKKAEKYDALCDNISALNEANRIDREHMKLLEQKINQLKYGRED